MDEWSREELAERYRNEAKMEGRVAAVHLESEEDELFWNAILQSCHPADYYFVTYSKSKKGKESRGKNECLSFAGYLDKRFFVCVDSDTDSLNCGMQSKADKFILQTYTYSWENQVCHAEELQERCSERNGQPKRDFDFSQFLRMYSAAVMQGVAMVAIDNKFITQLSAILDTQCKGEEMENNGELYVMRMGTALSKALFSVESSTIDNAVKELRILGIDENNAYLYSRGHNLYDIIVYIGKRCCSTKGLSFERDILLKDFPTSGYREIDAIRSDINAILN